MTTIVQEAQWHTFHICPPADRPVVVTRAANKTQWVEWQIRRYQTPPDTVLLKDYVWADLLPHHVRDLPKWHRMSENRPPAHRYVAVWSPHTEVISLGAFGRGEISGPYRDALWCDCIEEPSDAEKAAVAPKPEPKPGVLLLENGKYLNVLNIAAYAVGQTTWLITGERQRIIRIIPD